jgi:hypothetical protein
MTTRTLIRRKEPPPVGLVGKLGAGLKGRNPIIEFMDIGGEFKHG